MLKRRLLKKESKNCAAAARLCLGYAYDPSVSDWLLLIAVLEEFEMSKINEIREAIATKLDKYEAEASAIESQLNLSKDNAIEKLETQKNNSFEYPLYFWEDLTC